MSAADIALILLVLVGAISGYLQGFLMALFSFAAVVLGILGGFKLMGEAMLLIASHFDINKSILPYVAFAIVFIAILIGVRLLGKLIKVSIDKTFLGQVDQVAGAALGMLKAAFLLSVCLWIFHAMDLNLPEKWTGNSWLLPRIEAFAPQATLWLSDYVPFFKDVFT